MINIASIPSKFGGGKQNPNKVIIHAMGEYIENGEIDYHAKEWLDKLELSAHYLVTPSGVVIQTRATDTIAYHAKGFNTDSIGIEILVSGIHTYESFAERIKTPYLFGDQYSALVALCKKYKAHPFTRHSDLSPDRKIDPGEGLDWQTFLLDVKG